MGVAAYNRGSRLVSREADERMPGALSRADHQALKDEVTRLREQVATQVVPMPDWKWSDD